MHRADKGPLLGSSKQNFKALRAAPFDKTLIAVIGVLSEIQYESSIVGWMHAGGMRPSPNEIARVAALVGEDATGNLAPEREDPVQVEDVKAEEGEETVDKPRSSKRSSSVMSGQGGRSRKRTNTGSEVKNGDTSVEDKPEASEDPLPSDPPSIEEQEEPLPLTSSPPTSISAPQDDDPALASTQKDTKQQKRKQKRARQKPTYAVTHPLSADDPYPFFFNVDPKSESKLWFQDRQVYAYWVRRGLLALQECGIEPEDGVVDP